MLEMTLIDAIEKFVVVIIQAPAYEVKNMVRYRANFKN